MKHYDVKGVKHFELLLPKSKDIAIMMSDNDKLRILSIIGSP